MGVSATTWGGSVEQDAKARINQVMCMQAPCLMPPNHRANISIFHSDLVAGVKQHL